jgi:DNA processing protein
MTPLLSANTQTILLLTAPLIPGNGEASADLLTPREYQRVARFLVQSHREPADLLNAQENELAVELKTLIDGDRFKRLLDRGFQLTQAIDHWQSRAIWVVSSADDEYPTRIKERLKELASPVIYGCGDASILDTGGLAVVGSREVDASIIEYTESIGRSSALAKKTIISGGARGIDQAAMRSALAAGGKSVGVLADSLERAALNRDHRNLIIEGELVLISPFDPTAGFNVGHAMQRNKVIYSLADAALVVNSDYEKGGTWAGAVEQLDKLHFVPVYVRDDGSDSKSVRELLRRGAHTWPNPATSEDFSNLLERTNVRGPEQLSLLES